MRASCAPRAELARCRPLLGTYVEVALRDDPRAVDGHGAIEAAFDAMASVQRLMSFHDPASELSRLNAASAGAVLALHPWTVEVLRFARALHGASAGAFDPGVGARLVEWGLLPGGIPRAARSSIASVEILDDTHVRLRAPVCLDLGGVAKGFAVDRAVAALVAFSVAQARVNAGGDLRVLGDPQPVHVRRPNDPAATWPLGDLGDGAIATSATYFSRRGEGADARCALVDPRDGTPLATRRSFSVIAPTCMVADGLTKVLAVTGALPPDCARRWDAHAVVR